MQTTQHDCNKLMIIGYTASMMLKHQKFTRKFYFQWKDRDKQYRMVGGSGDVHNPICMYILNDSK